MYAMSDTFTYSFWHTQPPSSALIVLTQVIHLNVMLSLILNSGQSLHISVNVQEQFIAFSNPPTSIPPTKYTIH